jgi:simple sugar transport system ATP-binding protein
MGKKSMSRPLIELKGIVKRFGGVVALNKVDFHVDYAEVVGLVGDNGAGKSTLAKIMVGYLQPDEGEIYFEGRRVRFKSPADAKKHGIEIVYQDMALVPYMNVYRNLFLNREITKKIGFIEFLDKKKMKELTIKFLEEIGIQRKDPDIQVSKLSGGEKQSIAIARAIYFGSKIVILDEPTSALSVTESEKVLQVVLDLKKKGISSVVISHNIYHVYSVADRIVVLDRGKKILDIPKKAVTPEDIIDVIAHRISPQDIIDRIDKASK